MPVIRIASFIIVVLSVANCSERDPSKEQDRSHKGQLTISYVKGEIKASMNYDQLVRSFGEPVKDMGSGIHIYVYKMTDSTEIWIGFSDHILYANHMSEDQQLISVII